MMVMVVAVMFFGGGGFVGLRQRQALRTHRRPPPLGGFAIQRPAAAEEDGTVIALGRLARDIALAHVVFERVERPVQRRPETAAAARAQDVGVAGMEDLVERLAAREIMLVRVEAMDRD